jgi:hypothetical protein
MVYYQFKFSFQIQQMQLVISINFRMNSLKILGIIGEIKCFFSSLNNSKTKFDAKKDILQVTNSF